MAFLEGWRFLSSRRFLGIFQTLAGKLDLTAPLLFLGRTPVRDAFDDEIIGRFTGRVFAADLIADDQGAVVHESGKLELSTNVIPNLKVGQKLSQTTLNRLAMMQAGALLPNGSDMDAMEQWNQQLAQNLIHGVRMRMNALICAMQIGSLTYNRLGINIQQANWGAPSNIKLVPTQAWSNDGVTPNTSATPIDDILILATQVAADNYGIRYNRVTMSSKAFRFFVGTTQFANRAALLAGFATTAAMINVADQPTMQAMAGRLLNMEIELYDAAMWERQEDGTQTRTKVLPVNQVILSNTDNDNDANVADMANAVCTESMVTSLVGNAPNGLLEGPQYGPIGYYTPADAQLNPPGVIAWGAARCFPRLMVPEAFGTLTVGTWTS